jgi:hypothetical protein
VAGVSDLRKPVWQRRPCAYFFGTTAADATDGALAPTEFEAVTLKVYDLPFLRPVTVHLSAPVVEQVAPPGEAVAV